MQLEGFYTRPKMKIHSTMKKLMFTLLFIAGEMKWMFILGEVGVKQPIKNVNKPERDIETNLLEAKMQVY